MDFEIIIEECFLGNQSDKMLYQNCSKNSATFSVSPRNKKGHGKFSQKRAL